MKNVAEKILELRENQRATLERLQQAQGTVQELTALAQRQQGALMVLEELDQDKGAEDESN
tara:strand:+ start:2408 stop:2590 length:183 start_codon:yes stop_codon:yes gene_type:complete